MEKSFSNCGQVCFYIRVVHSPSLPFNAPSIASRRCANKTAQNVCLMTTFNLRALELTWRAPMRRRRTSERATSPLVGARACRRRAFRRRARRHVRVFLCAQRVLPSRSPPPPSPLMRRETASKATIPHVAAYMSGSKRSRANLERATHTKNAQVECADFQSPIVNSHLHVEKRRREYAAVFCTRRCAKADFLAPTPDVDGDDGVGDNEALRRRSSSAIVVVNLGRLRRRAPPTNQAAFLVVASNRSTSPPSLTPPRTRDRRRAAAPRERSLEQHNRFAGKFCVFAHSPIAHNNEKMARKSSTCRIGCRTRGA